MSDDGGERLCEHLILPVLIEQELDFEVSQGQPPFTEVIRGQLQAIIGEIEPIPQRLLDRLLRRRHVLVIVDHFSEMSESTRREIRPGHPDFPVNALIVTSRIEEKLDGVPKTTIKPLRIGGNRLSSFMEAYLTQRGKRDLFNDSEFFDACSRLSQIIQERDATVLFAKMYAEQMIVSQEDATEVNMPNNVPDLILSYINTLNSGIAEHKRDDREVHRDAKAIAWECLKQNYRPDFAKYDDVIEALTLLHSDCAAEERLDYLENRLRLVQIQEPGKNRVRFVLDPLAEYLAAMQVVDLFGQDEETWQSFIDKVAPMKDTPIEIKGFLLALWDCCLNEPGLKLPHFVQSKFDIWISSELETTSYTKNKTRVLDEERA
jgi:hypothetical protein